MARKLDNKQGAPYSCMVSMKNILIYQLDLYLMKDVLINTVDTGF